MSYRTYALDAQNQVPLTLWVKLIFKQCWA